MLIRPKRPKDLESFASKCNPSYHFTIMYVMTIDMLAKISKFINYVNLHATVGKTNVQVMYVCMVLLLLLLHVVEHKHQRKGDRHRIQAATLAMAR
jgi:hypothetical protein